MYISFYLSRSVLARSQRIGIRGNLQNKVTMLFGDLGKFSGFRLGREQTAHTGACSCANHVTWTWWDEMGQ